MNDADVVDRFEEGLNQITLTYQSAFDGSKDEQALRQVNARYVGPQGLLTGLLKLLPQLPKERRREFGQRSNQVKNDLQQSFKSRLEQIVKTVRELELEGAPMDVSLPGRFLAPGKLHPLTTTKCDLLDVFTSLGFDIADVPEIELYEYNFDKLGFPPDHPATDMQDSFFIRQPDGVDAKKILLRTHTSNVQIREMLRRKPPLAVIHPGTVYRRDDDLTHSPMFMQIEGFLVDERVTFAQLKGVLTLSLKRFFGADLQVRFRPSYFPFVEPGGEVDISCWFCKENGEVSSQCRVCKGTGWIEILGCGMIHPVVFEQVGYDAEKYTGFAFGMGIERIAMLRYGISDIRLLYENDPRFLMQF